MKALTLTQPWATLVAIGAKSIETRSWKTDYRGPLAIHAGKGFPVEARSFCCAEYLARRAVTEAGFVPPWRREKAPHQWEMGTLPRGVIVATCELVEVMNIAGETDAGPVFNDQLWLPESLAVASALEVAIADHSWEQERAFGDYTPGRFAWILGNVKPLDEPVPAKGRLGLWDWDAEVVPA